MPIPSLQTLLRSDSGPLTEDLILEPARHGLGMLPRSLQPAATTISTCGYCATGCRLTLHLDECGAASNLSPDPAYPVNLGMACPKGWHALDPLNAPDRAVTPLLRNASGSLVPTDWSTATTTLVGRFKHLIEAYGPESVAFLSTGQIPLEEMAFLGCLFKFGMGFLHGDANTRQCMATAVTAYKQSFGFDAPPGCYDDFEQSDVIVLVGANLCIAHPILWQRVCRNRRNPRIVVIDPRATETAQAATDFVQIRPKGDLPLFLALAHCIIRDGRTDPEWIARTEGYDDFVEFVADYPPDAVSAATGLTAADIESLARLVSDPTLRVSWWWTMGINQSYEGVRAAQAIINLCLITGNIGKPGTGPNSITGQCNAMGSRLFSNTTSLVGGHDFSDPDHRAKVASRLGIPSDAIPSAPSMSYDQILAAAENGTVKALWVVATNPFHSWVDSRRLAALRERLDFLVVQDMYTTTETALQADLLLPAAGWGEKDGTFINSERRISTIRAVRKAPGLALADFRIFRLIAHAWGCGDRFQRWTSPEAAFQLLCDLTADRPCDVSGIRDYQHLDDAGGIQWPFPRHSPDTATQRRLFADGIFPTATGKAKLLVSPPSPLPEPPDAEYPFILLTGRGASSQWHTLTRTSKSDVLSKLSPAGPWVEIHPDDAASLALAHGDPASISSRRGQLTAITYIAPTVQPGQVFIPMHYPEVNRLTHSSFDPHSRQPNYKACAVRIQPGSRIDHSEIQAVRDEPRR